VISHHPEGRAYAAFYEVMQLQVDMLVKLGIARKAAEALINARKFEVERRVLPQNHTRAVDAARLLDLPFMCMHTPADNHVSSFLQKLLDKKNPKKVQDIVDILLKIPEYKKAAGGLTGPRIILGSGQRPVGRISLEMTGGTEGPKDVFDKLYKAGVRTLVSMHLGEEHFKKVKDANLNVVIAGHISSDTLGLNLLLDRIEKEEKLETICCSGFYRIRRN
jgi:putative NIF3 family GTP cyclohydrolase 1 type 2